MEQASEEVIHFHTKGKSIPRDPGVSTKTNLAKVVLWRIQGQLFSISTRLGREGVQQDRCKLDRRRCGEAGRVLGTGAREMARGF